MYFIRTPWKRPGFTRLRGLNPWKVVADFLVGARASVSVPESKHTITSPHRGGIVIDPVSAKIVRVPKR